MAWRSRKDVHSGTLCRDTTRGDGGWAEPPGGLEALWRSPQYDHEDAPVFGPAGLSAARAARVEEAWSIHGVDRQGPGSRPKRPQGFVTLLRIGYGFVGIQLQSRRRDDFTPRLHGRCPEGSVRSCYCLLYTSDAADE